MDVRAAFLNIEEFYRRIYWDAPTATTIRTPVYTMSYSGIRWLNSANQFWYHLPLHTSEADLSTAEQFYEAQHADYTINFTTPVMPDLGPWLYERGLREKLNSPILAREGPPPSEPTRQNRRAALLEIVRVGAAHQPVLLSLMYDIFFVGPEAARCIVQPAHLLPESPMRHYVACVDGQAIGCGTASLSHGVAGLWSIGTLRGFRRQGVATALMGRMMEDAATDGIHTAVLLASPMGRPMYERRGFRVIGEAVQYGPAGYF